MSNKNRLADSSSPYLKQHAHNPVAWFPWCSEALEKARHENKPILLSVGYSACHWCHVMAHESFEDQETADLMNQYFVSIKVDREERPDIDKIYQTAHIFFANHSGGWPLTTFLNPHNQAPFFSGTYFPKESFKQMPSFKKVLHTIHDYFQNHQEEILAQTDAVTQTLGQMYAPATQRVEINAEFTQQVRHILANTFDSRYGGFGTEPKFPMTDYSKFLVYYWAKMQRHHEEDPQSLYMALHTLKNMLRGGIYDQLGGGFYRYSVDKSWTIPHFEKMLYDNGQLLDILADTIVISGDQELITTAQETANWVMREMQAPQGGYYAALDADSEGEEGKFYTWEKDEIAALLNQEEYALLEAHLGLDNTPNFENKWHLCVTQTIEQVAKDHASETNTTALQIHQAKQKLLHYRDKRIRPGLDHKVLTSWNALMIKGMAKTALVLQQQQYAESAQQALHFIQNTMWQDKTLRTSWCQGVSQPVAFLDDFAFLIDAILYLLQYRWDTQQLNFAIELADVLIEQFEDTDDGGYYFTANKHEKLLQRPRLLHDDTLPCGYAIATLVLRRLGLLCGNTHYLQSADRALAQATHAVSQNPHSCTTFLRAFDEQENPPELIILRGDSDALVPWQQIVRRYFSNSRFCFALPSATDGLPDALLDKQPHPDGLALAYICTGTQCLAPISDVTAFETQLQENSPKLPL